MVVFAHTMASSSSPSPSPSQLNASFALTDVEIGVLSLVNILFGAVGSMGNIVVCFAFVAYPRFRNTITKFILSLACSDLIVCLVAQPMFVVSLVKSYQQKSVSNAFEDARKTLTWVSLLASAGNLLGVTLDRYIAIIKPLRYEASILLGNAGLAIWLFLTLVWVAAICVGASTVSHPVMKQVGQLYVFVVITCLVLPLYSRVLYVARKHKRDITRISNHLTQVYNHHGQTTIPPSSTTQRQRTQHKDRGRHPVKTAGFICGVFILGWFPLLVFPFVYRSTNFGDRKLVFSLFQWVNTLALCSSAVNPIVYTWTDRKFRKALKTVYARWVARRLVSSQLRSENRG